MYIVTGGAGFIGSNIVRGLNARGETDILVVDDLTEGRKFANLADARITDYLDRDAFRAAIRGGADFGRVAAVFHEGACSDTTEWDGRLMMDVNFEASKELCRWCQAGEIPFLYASSAAVYGLSGRFGEADGAERPLNIYGWSKWVFDQWAARHRDQMTSPVVGFRYFNVYGPGEGHKGRMASVVHHFSRQLRESGAVRLFAASHGCGDGEHRRDFVHVGDVVRVNLWAFEAGLASGVYNVGTGTARSFNDVARAVIDWHGAGRIDYIPMPDDLRDAYQPFTEADLARLRSAGYREPFTPLEAGVRATLDALRQGPR